MNKSLHAVVEKVTGAYDPWQSLSIAIIKQAADDYTFLLKKLRKANEHDLPVICGRIQQIRNFFLGDWFQMLSDADGAMILKRLEKEVCKQ